MSGHQWLCIAVIACVWAGSNRLHADDLQTSPTPKSTLLTRHPQAAALLKEVDLIGGTMSLHQFAQFLREKSGVNVVLDVKALEEESNEVNQARPVPELKGVTLLAASRHYLEQLPGGIIEEPHRLVITTKSMALKVRTRALFWVGDLVSADPKFDLEDLRAPLFDRQEAIGRRFAAKLNKLTSWKLDNASIKDVAAKLRQELDENVIIETTSLRDERIDPEARQISCNYMNAPLSDILRWVLDSQNLCHYVHNEVLKITPQTHGYARRTLRVYPAQGLVFLEVQPERSEFVTATPQWNGPGRAWLGGYDEYSSIGLGPYLQTREPAVVSGERYSELQKAILPPMTDDQSGKTTGGSKAPDATTSNLSKADNTEHPLTASASNMLVADNAHSLLSDILVHTGGYPKGQWQYGLDGGFGGMLSMYYPSLTIVVIQNEEVHAEITQYLQQMRSLQAQHGASPAAAALTAKDTATRPEKAPFSLVKLLEELTGGPPDGPWSHASGEDCGTITYDSARMALTIRQTPETLDEIAGLLLQLRRDRYALFHNSRPWEPAAPVDRQPSVDVKSK